MKGGDCAICRVVVLGKFYVVVSGRNDRFVDGDWWKEGGRLVSGDRWKGVTGLRVDR